MKTQKRMHNFHNNTLGWKSTGDTFCSALRFFTHITRLRRFTEHIHPAKGAISRAEKKKWTRRQGQVHLGTWP